MFDPKLGIFKAPPLVNIPEFNGSLGELLYNSIRLQPKNLKKFVDVETGEVTTTEELCRDARKVVAGLQSIHLKSNAVIILIGGNGRNQFSVILGSIFYGASVFPISSIFKKLEIEHILTKAPPDVIFVEKSASSATIDVVKNCQINPLLIIVDSDEKVEGFKCFNDFINECDDISEEEFQPKGGFDTTKEIAVIISSSGSTGKPKPIAWTHSNIINFLLLFKTSSCYVTPNRSFLSTSEIFWTNGLLIFFCFSQSYQTYFYMRNWTPQVILNGIQKYKPESTMFLPTMLAAVLSYPHFNNYDTSSVKLVITSGTPLTMSLLQLMKKKWRNVEDIAVGQIYGTTELLNAVTRMKMGDETAPIDSAGFLARGSEAKVVDLKSGKKLLPNEVGEILIRYRGFHTFYFNNPEANANAYDQDGFYKTEDLGFITINGVLYITGRLNDIVKIKGYWVAPLEIEDVILAIEGVKDVSVVFKPHGYGYLVCAAVVKFPGAVINEQDIRTYVAERLSESKHLSGEVYFVSSLPYTSSGKIMRSQVLNLFNEKKINLTE